MRSHFETDFLCAVVRVCYGEAEGFRAAGNRRRCRKYGVVVMVLQFVWVAGLPTLARGELGRFALPACAIRRANAGNASRTNGDFAKRRKK